MLAGHHTVVIAFFIAICISLIMQLEDFLQFKNNGMQKFSVLFQLSQNSMPNFPQQSLLYGHLWEHLIEW